MKKIMVFVCTLLTCLCLLTGCTKPTQPGTFGENRFVLVDIVHDASGTQLNIMADKVTGVMYYTGVYGLMCPVYNGDGSLMLYDPIG